MNTNITIVLENIRSALNVGAIFRTCDATQSQKLYLLGITPYPPHNKIPKTALGAENTVNWEYIKNYETEEFIAKLPTPIISVELASNATNIYTSNLPAQECTLIFGHEIKGVSDFFLSISNYVYKVPMFGKKESLNVATTVGITSYEILRKWNYNTKYHIPYTIY